MPYAFLGVLIVGFLAFSLPPYLSGGSRVPPTFGLHYELLVMHVLLAGIAMLCAVVQLLPGSRGRWPALHRRTGRIYVFAAVPAALSALVIGAATPFGPLLAASNVVLGALWLWFTVDGYRAARARQFARHRRQITRSAVLALSVITNRVWTPALFLALQPLQHRLFGGNEEQFLWLVAGLGGWLGWTVPLVVTQVWLRRKPGVPPAVLRAYRAQRV